jgi:hypothetical protein
MALGQQRVMLTAFKDCPGAHVRVVARNENSVNLWKFTYQRSGA